MSKSMYQKIVLVLADWQASAGITYCVWAAYAAILAKGIYHTLRMLPILHFMIFTKSMGLNSCHAHFGYRIFD